jgi:hypothetical protein
MAEPADQVTYQKPTSHDPSTVFLRQKIEALNRLAAEVRGFLADAPDDEEVREIIRDCETVEQVAAEMGHSILAGRLSAWAEEKT